MHKYTLNRTIYSTNAQLNGFKELPLVFYMVIRFSNISLFLLLYLSQRGENVLPAGSENCSCLLFSDSVKIRKKSGTFYLSATPKEKRPAGLALAILLDRVLIHISQLMYLDTFHPGENGRTCCVRGTAGKSIVWRLLSFRFHVSVEHKVSKDSPVCFDIEEVQNATPWRQ